MDEEQENLIKKYDTKIRRTFNEKSGKWYFSIVDVIEVTGKTSDARNYWKVLKNRLNKTQNQLVTSCNQLKMESSDGKFYLTDTGDRSTIIELLRLVSSNHIPSFEAYFDSLSSPKSENVISLNKIKLEPIIKSKNQKEYAALSYPQTEDTGADFLISIDLYRKENFLILEAFIAGVYLADLEIIATCDNLTIRGKREFRNKINIQDYHNQEISWGIFYRKIKLPFEIDINRIEAFDNRGLLTVKMKTIDKSYSRKIKIM